MSAIFAQLTRKQIEEIVDLLSRCGLRVRMDDHERAIIIYKLCNGEEYARVKTPYELLSYVRRRN
jgi:hypothetical protein